MNDDRPNPPGSELSRPAPLSDYEQRLVANSVAPIGSRWKNWKLQGSGQSPFFIYGFFVGIVVFWLLGACILSLLGPIAMLLAIAALFAVVGYYSKRAARREMWTSMGLCPECGYDLRATEAACPECNTPVPEDILRRRRLMVEMRPGQAGANAGKVTLHDAMTEPVLALPAPSARAPTPELPPIPLVEMPNEKTSQNPIDELLSDPDSAGTN